MSLGSSKGMFEGRKKPRRSKRGGKRTFDEYFDRLQQLELWAMRVEQGLQEAENSAERDHSTIEENDPGMPPS